jgi:hypothetical protein
MDPESCAFRWLSVSAAPQLGATGMLRHLGFIYVCAQGNMLYAYREADMQLVSAYAFKHVRDPHSMFLDEDGQILVVSTGTDEVYSLTLANGQCGGEHFVWRVPGTAGNTDGYHLNSICRFNGERVVSYCFSGAQSDRSVDTVGGVISMDSGASYAQGVRYPHSLLQRNGALYLCEQPGIVRTLDGRLYKQAGWARGLVFSDDILWAAFSRYRPCRLDKRMTPAEFDDYCTRPIQICALDPLTLRCLRTIDLGGLGFEVYDILPVETSLTASMVDPCDPIVARMHSFEKNFLC